MKTTKHLMAVILLGGLLAGQPLAQGQDKKEDKPETKPGVQRDAGTLIIEGRIRQMDKVLTLAEEQKQKLRPIFAEEAKTLSAVRDDNSLPIETKIAKRKEINAATQTKIKPILTPEQVEKWEKQQSRARKTTK